MPLQKLLLYLQLRQRKALFHKCHVGHLYLPCSCSFNEIKIGGGWKTLKKPMVKFPLQPQPQTSPGKAQKWGPFVAEFGAGHTLGVHGGVDSGVGGQSWMGSAAAFRWPTRNRISFCLQNTMMYDQKWTKFMACKFTVKL